MTWRQVEVTIRVDPILRSSLRIKASKKAKNNPSTSSSKGKEKRFMTREKEDI